MNEFVFFNTYFVPKSEKNTVSGSTSVSISGGFIGQASGTSMTQCHNFGFQYDASAPIIICHGNTCGGFIGHVRAVTLAQCSLKRGLILIFGGCISGPFVGGFIGVSDSFSSVKMSQVAVLEEVSFQIDSSANCAYVGGLFGDICYGTRVTFTDSFCRASFNSDVSSPVKNLFSNFYF